MESRSAAESPAPTVARVETTTEQTEEIKGKVENFDIDMAITELTDIMRGASSMYHQLKKVKFDYLVQVCELYSRMDYPSIMIESCRKEIHEKVPRAKNIERMDF